MPHILSDAQIAGLLADEKPVKRGEITRLKGKGPGRKPRISRGRHSRKLYIVSKGKRHFQITAEKHATKPFDFSVILTFVWHGRCINLIRCNGHHTEHTNQLESKSGTGVAVIPANTFHVHKATERYQRAGKSAESYAEPTSEYSDYEGAVEFMFGCFGFRFQDDSYRTRYPLFGE